MGVAVAFDLPDDPGAAVVGLHQPPGASDRDRRVVRRHRASASRSAPSSAACCSSTGHGARSSSSTSRSPRWPWSPARAWCRTRATPRPAASTLSVRCCRSAFVGLLVVDRHRSAVTRLDRPRHARRLRGLGALLLAGVRRLGGAPADPLLDVRFFRNPRFSAASAVDLDRVLRPVRVHLHDHDVLPAHPRLQRAAGRLRDPPVRGRHGRPVAGGDAARQAGRDQGRRRHRHAADGLRFRRRLDGGGRLQLLGRHRPVDVPDGRRDGPGDRPRDGFHPRLAAARQSRGGLGGQRHDARARRSARRRRRRVDPELVLRQPPRGLVGEPRRPASRSSAWARSRWPRGWR